MPGHMEVYGVMEASFPLLRVQFAILGWENKVLRVLQRNFICNRSTCAYQEKKAVPVCSAHALIAPCALLVVKSVRCDPSLAVQLWLTAYANCAVVRQITVLLVRC